jgi:hypothetical protein
MHRLAEVVRSDLHTITLRETCTLPSERALQNVANQFRGHFAERDAQGALLQAISALFLSLLPPPNDSVGQHPLYMPEVDGFGAFCIVCIRHV